MSNIPRKAYIVVMGICLLVTGCLNVSDVTLVPTLAQEVKIQTTSTRILSNDGLANKSGDHGESFESVSSTYTPLQIVPSDTSTLISTSSLINTPTSSIEPFAGRSDKITATPTIAPAQTTTPTATPTITPTQMITPTATYWPTVTKQLLSSDIASQLPACENRVLSDELLIVVTQQFGLPQSYEPSDLVNLAEVLPNNVTLGEDYYARAIIIDPLTQLVEAMHSAELRPSILSAYRSYGEQHLAWKWWEGQYPGRVAIMSAKPGHSEHQLGTTVDFGSPETKHLFHVDFAETSEGMWLFQNAHHFGFTLSYPKGTYDKTGFKYEPWHYRYVGKDLAGELYQAERILTEWQLQSLEIPCSP